MGANGSSWVGPSRGERARGFTLIELLVVVAIIGLLISILVPSLSAARQRARGVRCLTNLHTLGQGASIYLNENTDVLVPGRLPKVDRCHAQTRIYGRLKFRPTFLALMSTSVGAPPFSDPKACKDETDIFGEPGDMQNYDYPVYVCPSVPEWTDERNGSYGYNYQFLGNSRLSDESVTTSYKNWPVPLSRIRHPGNLVMAGDCMGTAASFPPAERLEYEDDSREARRFGNEGFNLDPPRVDPVNGEMAGLDASPPERSAVDPRHSGKGNIVWVDGHAGPFTLEELGYVLNPDESIGFEGLNHRWTPDGRDVPWTPEYAPFTSP